MRREAPLIIGAGPAGCAAAIVLARSGNPPLLVDRDRQAGDPLCGGFLSWRTAEQLRDLGVDCESLRAHAVHELRLFTKGRRSSMPLPQSAFGLSRHALDNALRKRALLEGAKLEAHTVRRVEGNAVVGEDQEWVRESVFLASGKHDIRGMSRPRGDADPALGLRLRLPASNDLLHLVGGAIELHLFRGGYAGIILHENHSANVCLAVRKSRLAETGGDPQALLTMLAEEEPNFAARLQGGWREARVDTIGSVPYGWVARSGVPGLFRLGDQAAVIPSLAGEGISIALASGTEAAQAWLEGGAEAAPAYQACFARKAAGPMRMAGFARRLAESRKGHLAVQAIARFTPGLIGLVMDRTRIS